MFLIKLQVYFDLKTTNLKIIITLYQLYKKLFYETLNNK